MPTAEARRIRVEARPCRYWIAGPERARALLLLHGGLGDAALHWGRVLPDLARDFHVFAPDLPGFGATAPLPEPSYAAYAAWVAAFCAAAEAPAGLVLVGNSMGAAIARLVAAASPAVARVVLVDGGGIPRLPPAATRLLGVPGVRGGLLALAGALATADFTLPRYVHYTRLLTPALRRRMKRGIRAYLRAQSAMLRLPPPAPAAFRPRCPAAVVWGAADRLGPPSLGAAIAAEAGAPPPTIIPDAGHMPMFDQPAAFAAALRALAA
jgi:pimeloyl-ACP methyl ester carboxylesterase